MRIRTSGTHVNYPKLWEAAAYFRAHADLGEPGYFYPYLACTAFAFFAFEGFLNEMLDRVALDKPEFPAARAAHRVSRDGPALNRD